MTIARSVWMALTLAALAACAPVPQPETPAAPPAPPPSEAPPPGPPSASSDQDFIDQAIGLGQSEIGMGRLARGKGAAKSVRFLAERMILGHLTIDHHLAFVAKHLKLTPAPPPDDPPPELLMADGGPDFDRRYLDLVIAAHQNMVALFESEEAGGQNPHLKLVARSLLPMLRHHLAEAEVVKQKLGF